MTHDLIKKILESLDARVQKIVVNDVRDNTFYAVIHLRLGGADITVDSRPCPGAAGGRPDLRGGRGRTQGPDRSRWPRRPR